ncbi:MAG: OmpA family protein, partial [Melioribacteraceae bacterium]|nr:OmpA family protein [Melioribacteraceae bacterium]
NPDTDGDGLKDGEEVMQYNSDPLNADSDGDGLKDGEEVKAYQTDPLKADTDNDGLNDFAEVVTYKTDPLNADTDGDTLKDGEEVNKYKTDPNKADTDMDGLNDGIEVNKTKTDPLNADTDGEGLKDGEEVTKYNTNPLEVDTDKGSIDDFVEVARGTNPLDPADDIMIERVTIYDVNFGFDSSNLSANNQKKLDDLIEKLKIRSSVKVKVEGYTDSVGPAAYNLKLSKRRADVVKQYLVDKGIKSDRISTIGFGEKNPVDSNKTKEGRAKNRRVEISKAE